MLFGDSILNWVIRLVLAVLAFYLVEWLFPALMRAVRLSPPDPITLLIALAVALLVFFGYPSVVKRA